MYTMQLSQTLNIKKKARIMVEKSCVLIGIVDDKGILAPNEVYIQIRQDNQGSKRDRNQTSKFFDAFKEVMEEAERAEVITIKS